VRKHKNTLAFYGYISPWLLGLLLFTAIPMATSLYLSFTEYNILTPAKWIGFKNYTDWFNSPDFKIGIKNTFLYTLLRVPFAILLSLGVALLLNRKARFINFFRTAFYLPSVVPIVGAVLIWDLLFNYDFGLINYLLSFLGIEQIDFYSSKSGLFSITLIGLWGSIGPTMIIMLAGLKGVPQQLYEAVEIDGGGSLRKLIHITLPMISPAIFFNFIMGIIGALQMFAEVAMTTKGGPNKATLTMTMDIYNHAFVYNKMGYASAGAWILFAITLVFTLIVFRSSQSYVHYEGEGR